MTQDPKNGSKPLSAWTLRLDRARKFLGSWEEQPLREADFFCLGSSKSRLLFERWVWKKGVLKQPSESINEGFWVLFHSIIFDFYLFCLHPFIMRWLLWPCEVLRIPWTRHQPLRPHNACDVSDVSIFSRLEKSNVRSTSRYSSSDEKSYNEGMEIDTWLPWLWLEMLSGSKPPVGSFFGHDILKDHWPSPSHTLWCESLLLKKKNSRWRDISANLKF